MVNWARLAIVWGWGFFSKKEGNVKWKTLSIGRERGSWQQLTSLKLLKLLKVEFWKRRKQGKKDERLRSKESWERLVVSWCPHLYYNCLYYSLRRAGENKLLASVSFSAFSFSACLYLMLNQKGQFPFYLCKYKYLLLHSHFRFWHKMQKNKTTKQQLVNSQFSSRVTGHPIVNHAILTLIIDAHGNLIQGMALLHWSQKNIL